VAFLSLRENHSWRFRQSLTIPGYNPLKRRKNEYFFAVLYRAFLCTEAPRIGEAPHQLSMRPRRSTGQQSRGNPERGLGNDLDERVVIAILVKDLGAAIAPAQDVVAKTSGSSTGGAWHGKSRMIRVTGTKVNKASILCRLPRKLPVSRMSFP